MAIGVVLLWIGSAGAGKLTVAQQCEKAKIKADAVYARCVGKAKIKGITGERGKKEERLAKCELKLTKRLQKAEDRAESKGGSCATPAPVAEGPHWLMVQDSDGVRFDFDGSIDEGCPGEAFWSGTMTMTNADPETLWFSDRPDRLAFTQSTDEFVTGFGETFTESTGGDPNGVLNWEDSEDNTEKHAVLELRYVEGTSPSYDGEAGVLTYSVCGGCLTAQTTSRFSPRLNPAGSISFVMKSS